MKKILLFLPFLLVFLYSCNNDVENIVVEEKNDNNLEKESELESDFSIEGSYNYYREVLEEKVLNWDIFNYFWITFNTYNSELENIDIWLILNKDEKKIYIINKSYENTYSEDSNNIYFWDVYNNEEINEVIKKQLWIDCVVWSIEKVEWKDYFNLKIKDSLENFERNFPNNELDWPSPYCTLNYMFKVFYSKENNKIIIIELWHDSSFWFKTMNFIDSIDFIKQEKFSN